MSGMPEVILFHAAILQKMSSVSLIRSSGPSPFGVVRVCIIPRVFGVCHAGIVEMLKCFRVVFRFVG